MTHISSAELRRRADVQDHYEKGGKVEMRSDDLDGTERWMIVEPQWAWEVCDYRPYVEPPKPVEGWSWLWSDGSLSPLFKDRAACERYGHSYKGIGRAVLFREVV